MAVRCGSETRLDRTLSHMLQLSVASDHSPMRTGSPVACTFCAAGASCTLSRKPFCGRMSNHAWYTWVSRATPPQPPCNPPASRRKESWITKSQRGAAARTAQ